MALIYDTISRDAHIESRTERERYETITAQISRLYSRIGYLYGALRSATVAQSALSQAITILSTSASGDDTTVILNQSNDTIYPTSAGQYEKVASNPEFGTWNAGIVSSRDVFIDQYGTLLPAVSVSRSSTNTLYTDEPDYLGENNVDAVIVSGGPYLVQYQRSDMANAELSVTVSTEGVPFVFNALKILPFPGGGCVHIAGAYTNRIEPLLALDDEECDYTDITDLSTTFPAYLHLQQTTTDSIRVSFTSTVFNPDLDSIVIGVSKIWAVQNLYSVNSYCGFAVTVPENMTRLSRLTINPDPYCPSTTGVYCRVYDTLAGFNSLSTGYLVRCGVDQILDIPVEGTIYICLEIVCPENISPSVKSISLEFSS